MQSVNAFRELLMRNGVSGAAAHLHAQALCAHASVCCYRTDAKSGAFRDFVAATSRMTRNDTRVRIFNDTDAAYADERRAACEALHDLIMEGV